MPAGVARVDWIAVKQEVCHKTPHQPPESSPSPQNLPRFRRFCGSRTDCPSKFLSLTAFHAAFNGSRIAWNWTFGCPTGLHFSLPIALTPSGRLWVCDISSPCLLPLPCFWGAHAPCLPGSVPGGLVRGGGEVRDAERHAVRHRRGRRRGGLGRQGRAHSLRTGSNGWSMVFSAPRMEMRGQVLFTFWLRAENLPPLTPGFMLTLVAHDKQTGQWACHRQTRVYGVNLQTQGYTPVTSGPRRALDRRDLRPGSDPPVGRASRRASRRSCTWTRPQIAVPVLDAPRVLEVSPDEDPLPAPGAGDGAHLPGQSHRRCRSRGRWWARRSAPPTRAGKSSGKASAWPPGNRSR